MKKVDPRGTTLDEWLEEELRDPEMRRLYEQADLELRVALEVAKAREAAQMTQAQLAKALKTKQQTISRLESGGQNVTLGTLHRIARATKRRLIVKLTNT